MRTSQGSSCRNLVNTAKRRIDRIVNKLANETGAEDVGIFCFRENGRFNCSITLTFGTPQFNGSTSKARSRKR